MSSALSAAQALEEAGQLLEAAAAYRQVGPDDAGHATALGRIGVIALVAGQAAEAGRWLERALALEEKPELWAELAQARALEDELEAAEDCCRRALALDPGHFVALCRQGEILARRDQVGAAVESLQRALKQQPDSPEANYNLAFMLGLEGHSKAAIESYGRALANRPEWPEALRQRGELWLILGQSEPARRDLEAAARLDPADALTRYHLGALEILEDNPAAAAQAFLQVIEGAPGNAVLLLNSGVRLLALEQPEAAAEACRRALALAPELALAHSTLGRALVRLQEPEAAAAAFAGALRIDPELHEALLNLATLQRRAGRLEEAEALYLRCREIDPSAWHHEAGLAALRQAEGRWSEAAAHFETALARRPGNYRLLNDLGNVLQSAGRYDEALEHYRQAVEAAPDEPSPLFNAAALLFRIERYAEAIELFRGVVERWPEQSAAFTPLAHALLRECNWQNLGAVVTRVVELAREEVAGDQDVTVSPFALYSLPVEAEALGVELARRISAQAAAAAPAAAPFLHDRSRQRPRLGYISPDFRAHSVGLAFRELLMAHDRERFEILGYGLTPDDGEPITQTLRQGFDGFRDLSQEGDLAAAQLIHQDGIDILVDLAGHTRGARLGILALEPAPVQVHFLGYANTLGADYVRYLISDEIYYPPQRPELLTETAVYLPELSLPAPRPALLTEPASRAAAGLPDEGFVFANFNRSYKLEPTAFGLWMRILKQTPGSYLWLLAASPGAEANLIREAELRGVAGERLLFAARLPYEQHIARQRQADLMLDTLFHTGGVTTMEALWAGLPVLSHAAAPSDRSGAAILAAIGLEDLAAPSLDAYQEMAIGLAADPARQAALKARLAAQRESAPLFDAVRFARHLERAFEMIWQDHKEGRRQGQRAPIRVPVLPRREGSPA